MNYLKRITPTQQGLYRTAHHASVLASILLFVLLLPLRAQPRADSTPPVTRALPDFFSGIYGSAFFLSYDASVQGQSIDPLSSAPGQFPFNLGDGFGIGGGILFEVPFSSSFRLGIRAGFQPHTGTLTNQYINSTEVRGRDGSTQIATIEGTVDTKMSHINITPYAYIAPFDAPFYFIVGPTILFPGTATYTYSEVVISPRDVVFRANGQNSRRIGAADKTLPTTTTVTGITAGVGYDLELAEDIYLFGEVQFQPTLGNYLDPLLLSEFWRSNTIAPTIGLRIGFGGGYKAPPRDKPTPPIVRNDTAAPRPTDTTKFDAKGVTSTGLSDTLRISTRRVQATQNHALLPYIFFDRDSAGIPSRYIQLDGKSRKNFAIERLPRGNTMEIYYQLLNIVAERMRDNRRMKIKLSGYRSAGETDSTLSWRRTWAVKKYLTEVWRIPDKRIEIDSVHIGLPPNPSLSDVDAREAAKENQRVEIYSINNIAEAPVRLPDTAFLEPVGMVRFLPPATTPDSLATGTWSLDITIGDSLIKDAVAGVGVPPSEINYPIRPDINPRAGSISSTLVIQDSSYNELVRVPSNAVILKQTGGFQEERTVEDGKYVDTYTLLLYSFDSSQVAGFAWQAIELIRSKLDSNAEVTIIGHTDKIGMPSYNKDLSRRRAEFAAQILQVTPKRAVGVGEQNLLYDNDSPEGRYYSRTVTVIVETPIPPGTVIPPPLPKEEVRVVPDTPKETKAQKRKKEKTEEAPIPEPRSVEVPTIKPVEKKKP